MNFWSLWYIYIYIYIYIYPKLHLFNIAILKFNKWERKSSKKRKSGKKKLFFHISITKKLFLV